MAPHAEFAAVIGIRQQMMQNFVRVLYNANQISHQLRIPDWGSGVAVDFFLDVPEILFLRATADSYVIMLKGWGQMTVTLPDRTPETRDVIFTARVQAPHRITLLNAALIFGVNGMQAILVDKEIEVFGGGPFSPEVQAFIDSEEFHVIMENSIRWYLSRIQQLMPPINISVLGPIVSTPNTTSTARALDGALVVGLDFTSGNTITSGDPNQFTDVTDGMDIGMWANPAVWIPLMTEDIQSQIETRIEEQEATLNRFSITLHEGFIHISGKVTKSPGTATFSMDAYPKLTRGGYYKDLGADMFGRPCRIYVPLREGLWFDIENQTVDIDYPWWYDFLTVLAGILTFGIGALVIRSILEGIRNNIVRQFASYDGYPIGERTSDFTLPGDTNNTTIRLRFERFECHTYGVYIGLTMKPQFLAPKITGDQFFHIESLARGQTFRYKIDRLAFNVHPADPQLRVRWTVRRIDNNEIIHNFDGMIQTVFEISDDLRQTILEMPDIAIQLVIACRVYRTLGSDITDLYNDKIRLYIWDRLDRSRPFVRWSHYVLIPRVHVEKDGTHTMRGYQIIRRISRIHHTNFPNRCRNVSGYSLYKPWQGRLGKRVSEDTVEKLTYLEYLDRLPDSLSRLASRREVCDYCFFGGPTKNPHA